MAKKKRYSVMYKKTRIYLPFNPRKGQCKVCGRKIGNVIKRTQIHHFVYAYLTKTVLKKPTLVLDYTIEVCYPCHKIADGFRIILDRTQRTRMIMVAQQLPEHQLKKLDTFCKVFLKWYDKGRK